MFNKPTFALPFNGLNFDDISNNLQGNILKSHGRNYANHIFVTFADTDEVRNKVKKLIHRMTTSGEITSTHRQFADTEEFKRNGTEFLFTGINISKIGYQYLLKNDARIGDIPNNQSFLQGMKDAATQAKLNDPAIDEWETPFNRDIHAMFILAHAQPKSLSEYTQHLINRITPLVQDPDVDIFIQQGNGIMNKNHDHIEHFGYVDGISQPVFFKEELDNIVSRAKTDKWNPVMSIESLIIADPLGTEPNSFGTYFVFRKLEQNVRDFKLREQALAVELGFDDRELAGAMVVGRFENGMPVTMSDEDISANGNIISKSLVGKINNFNYNSDAAGAKCPFHSHIRKTNPRGTGGFESPTDEKKHLFARRGITYGSRVMDDKDDKILKEATFEEMPLEGVGLLFMCCNVDIENQFEFMQANWANNNTFPAGQANGIDPIIGQADDAGNQKYATEWGKPSSITTASGFKDFVTMRGGEYFFVPSISFLKSL